MESPLDVPEILRVLTGHGADFILVVGIAAILHGSPLTTEDLDLLYSTRSGNCQALTEALEEIDAFYRDPAGRRIRPDVEKLATLRLHLLSTRFGRLGLLTTIGDGSTYEDLFGVADLTPIGDLEVRVLGLEAIIRSKEEANRPKDLYQLPFLRQVLRETQDPDSQPNPAGPTSDRQG